MPPNWLKKKEPRRFSFRNRALCFASMNKRTPAHSCPSKGPILDVDRASSSSKREAQKNKRSSRESFHDNLELLVVRSLNWHGRKLWVDGTTLIQEILISSANLV